MEINENNIVVIQTHDKRFHVDDVGAISLLTSYFNQKGIQVHLIRSRENHDSDILIDTGGIYDPEKDKFDHHQEGCNSTYNNKTSIPLSSIGMVWKQYGVEILSLYMKTNSLPELDNYQELCDEIYFKIVQEIDAHDNGISVVKGGLNICSVISAMNSTDVDNEDDQMEAFQEAISLFGKIFEIKLKDIIRKYSSHHTNINKVKLLLDDNEKEYLIVNEKIETIYKCLNELDPAYRIKFLIFTDGEISVKTRSRPENIFQPIIPLLSETELKKELGDDLIFAHKGLFLAKTKNLESAIKIIELSMNKKINEDVPSSYLKVKIPRVSDNVMKFGVITLGCLGGILLYKYFE